MKGQKIGYRRVSTASQNLDRQDFAGIDIDQVFEEKRSASNRDRPELERMIQFARAGDQVYVHSIDRLARSTSDLLSITDELKKKGVSVHFSKQGINIYPDDDDRANHLDKLTFGVLGLIAEFERDIMRERQAEGIAKAKAKGVYKGRGISIPRDEVREYLESGATITAIAKKMKCTRAAIYKVRDELGLKPDKITKL